MEHKYLVMVTDKNNNKYYSMKKLDGSSFEVEWGRVGYPPQKKTFPLSQWDRKFKSKLKKGYVDQTDLFKKVERTSEFKHLSNSDVQRFVDLIISFSKQSVASNYTIDAASVTLEQITQAQNIIDKLVNISNRRKLDKFSFDTELLGLFATIPRKMKKVKNHLLTDGNKKEMNKIIQVEQDTLDSLSAQNNLAKVEVDSSSNDKTVLEALGIDIGPVTTKEVDAIKSHLGDSRDLFRRAFKAINLKTGKRFDTAIKKSKNKATELLWHGSRNENWFNILQTGLLIRPSCAVFTGAMFGNGIYFAPRAKKSIGYTSRRGSYWASGSSDKAFLALFNVHVGRKKVVDRSDYSMDYDKIIKDGYDSLYAKKSSGFLYNDELIVYDINQCTVQYIVEIG